MRGGKIKLKCPYCESENIIVEGKYPVNRISGIELYRCESCKHRFTRYCIEARKGFK